ncbi:hypothetical protein NCC49_002952 [Naganishia albida]|nr:hypothetical protein NCC49_002952 [Naganishia albida]
MPPKAVKERAVKGDEAEEASLRTPIVDSGNGTDLNRFVSRTPCDKQMVLQYMKSVNRPYASTDVSANLKNKVTKANTQKVLQTLADKGSLTLKTYGKQTIFVYNQDKLETIPSEGLAEIDAELKAVKEELDIAKKTSKDLSNETTLTLAQPKTDDIEEEIKKTEAQNALTLKHLVPLRKACENGSSDEPGDQGDGPIGQDKLDALDAEWTRWRKEWVARRKVYQALFDMAQPELSGADRANYEEDIGVDDDPAELKALENSDLCKPKVAARAHKKASFSAAHPGPPDSGHGRFKVASSAGTKRKRAEDDPR